MRIGLDLLFLVPGESGGRETYARELVAAMLERDPELNATAFVNPAGAPVIESDFGDAVRVVTLPVSLTSRRQWATGELVQLPRAAGRARIEVLHSLANFAPASGSFRRVLTLHDLQYRAVPETLPWPRRVATAMLVGLAARRADRIITVSSASREEIVSQLGVAPGRIDVIPNGVSQPPLGVARRSFGERKVVLSVGTNLPHKNLRRLVEGLALMRGGERPLLLIAGHGTDEPALRSLVGSLSLDDDVRLLGYQEADELESLYASADCLVLPSLYEGFGLPVLEAMARALPVVCSDIPALREVGGGAALYFDARNPAAIADALRRALGDPVLTGRLKAAGRERAAGFSWSAAALATLECYGRVLELPTRASRSRARSSHL
jgi:glycosyltransferase involved in cell wall biosynthesis